MEYKQQQSLNEAIQRVMLGEVMKSKYWIELIPKKKVSGKMADKLHDSAAQVIDGIRYADDWEEIGNTRKYPLYPTMLVRFGDADAAKEFIFQWEKKSVSKMFKLNASDDVITPWDPGRGGGGSALPIISVER